MNQVRMTADEVRQVMQSDETGACLAIPGVKRGANAGFGQEMNVI